MKNKENIKSDINSIEGLSVEKKADAKLPTEYGEFQIYGFEDKITKNTHIALTMGKWEKGESILCRVHSKCLTGDVFHSLRCDCGEQLDKAMKIIAKEKKGVILYMDQEGRGIGIINKIKAYKLQEEGLDTVEANIKLGFDPDLRNYKAAADMLKILAISKVRILTNNPEKLDELTEYGIEIEDRVQIDVKPNDVNLKYLLTKQNKMGHLTNYKEN